MGRIFGLVLIVAAVYLAATTWVGDGSGPFGGDGGLDVSRSERGAETSDDAPSRSSLPRRAGERVQRSFDEGAARRQALLPD